ncbi:amidohydrolase family protein [Pseudonocardia ailaonensis]|uniref:Amidohydrolase family protein n=1 Tax=Pseudonocardia ailaonensis TaxID=367279 RepID=A0ABN2NHM6_9PSEU
MTSTANGDAAWAESAKRLGRSGVVTFIDEPEPEPLFCPMISVDDHLLEPPTLFDGRLPQRLQADAPRLERQEDGARWWVIGDAVVPISMANGASGRPISEWSAAASEYDEFRRAVWDPNERLHDMDLTGVWASLCFGSIVWGFAGSRFSQMPDPEVGLACVRAWNDWMVEEWWGAAPDRFIPCQLPWLRDPVEGAAEIYRNAERGVRSVSFSENPEPLGFPNIYDRSWDPYFRACEETGTVVNLHVGSSGTLTVPSSSSPGDVLVALFPLSGVTALVDWIYSEIPTRFPGLRIVMSEAGVSWVPMAIERLARAQRQSSAVGRGWPAGDLSPTEIVRRNFAFTSIEDPAGMRQLDLIGEDIVMVETDYPHFDSTWPDCQQMLRSQLAGLPADVVRKVCYENAARIYHQPPPPPELVAASEVGLPG